MDNVTQIHYIWPTLIYSFNSNSNILQEHEKMIADIKDDVNGKKRQSPYGPRYQAGFEKFGLNQGRDDLHNLPSFKKFSIFIEQLSTEILIEEGFKNQTIQITNMWANQQNDGSVHPPHSHANSVLSGVYYIKATNESSKIHFFDPRAQAKVLKPRRDTFTSDNSNVYGIPSVTGTGADNIPIASNRDRNFEMVAESTSQSNLNFFLSSQQDMNHVYGQIFGDLA